MNVSLRILTPCSRLKCQRLFSLLVCLFFPSGAAVGFHSLRWLRVKSYSNMCSTQFCRVHESFPQVAGVDDKVYLDSSSGLRDTNCNLQHITQWVVDVCIYGTLQNLTA